MAKTILSLSVLIILGGCSSTQTAQQPTFERCDTIASIEDRTECLDAIRSGSAAPKRRYPPINDWRERP